MLLPLTTKTCWPTDGSQNENGELQTNGGESGACLWLTLTQTLPWQPSSSSSSVKGQSRVQRNNSAVTLRSPGARDPTWHHRVWTSTPELLPGTHTGFWVPPFPSILPHRGCDCSSPVPFDLWSLITCDTQKVNQLEPSNVAINLLWSEHQSNKILQPFDIDTLLR